MNPKLIITKATEEDLPIVKMGAEKLEKRKLFSLSIAAMQKLVAQ
jgi:hypothetical protein